MLQQYKNNIYGYAVYLLKNEMDADDATQEVFIKLWNNMGKFNYLAAKTWLMRTTHNICIDILRKRNSINRHEFVIDDEISENFTVSSGYNTPEEEVHFKLMDSKVKEAIKNMPENLRSVFVLYEIQGFKYKEISKALDLPLNTVKVYILRARKKLQKDLKNYELSEVF